MTKTLLFVTFILAVANVARPLAGQCSARTNCGITCYCSSSEAECECGAENDSCYATCEDGCNSYGFCR